MLSSACPSEEWKPKLQHSSMQRNSVKKHNKKIIENCPFFSLPFLLSGKWPTAEK